MTSENEVWTTKEAISLCTILEPLAAMNNCHIALTGGLLYRTGMRKDCDIVVYRRGMLKGEKELPEFNREEITKSFSRVLTIVNEFTRVTKAAFDGKPVDLLFVNMISESDNDTPSAATE